MTPRSMVTVVGLQMLCVIASAALAQETASFESVNYPNRFMRHAFLLGELTPLSSDLDRKDATFVLRPGLSGTPGAISFESINYPGQFLRHQNFRLKLNPNDGSTLFHQDASFLPRPALAGQGMVSYESVNFPGFFVRHRDFHLWVEKNDGSQLFGLDASFQKRPGLAALGGGGGVGGGLSADAQAVLNAHSGYRAKHCVPNLTWSAQLASGAQQWASGCKYGHSGTSGENIAWSRPTLSPTKPVDSWYSEIGQYDFNNPIGSYKTGKVLHFTQVVWRGSTQLGCGIATCQAPAPDGANSGWGFIVCRYAPPGNFNGENPGVLDANVPPPCK
jgi:Alpha-L-arabinofuranosidase B (ABFB) domain/Cysteine-rich secretory protein family